MELKISYSKQLDVVIATPVASITKENVWKTIRETLEVCDQNNCFNIVYDVRQCKLGQSTTQSLQTMGNLGNFPGMTFKHRTAVVYNPKLYPTERAEFVENVINNRANPAYRIFIDYDDAMKWLIES